MVGLPPSDLRKLRALDRLRTASLNFDPAELERGRWNADERLQQLPAEAPGPPVANGPWEIARRLMRGYEFADPSIVRAHYDPGAALEGRDMLLEVRFHGLRIRVGCRIGQVYDAEVEVAGRSARVWGWSYRTLTGHFEQGEMHWEVVKWPDTGEVAFRIHARSRRAPHPNPFVRIGFRLFGRREQIRFLDSTCTRMRTLVEQALASDGDERSVRAAAGAATARPTTGAEPVHDAAARIVARRPEP